MRCNGRRTTWSLAFHFSKMSSCIPFSPRCLRENITQSWRGTDDSHLKIPEHFLLDGCMRHPLMVIWRWNIYRKNLLWYVPKWTNGLGTYQFCFAHWSRHWSWFIEGLKTNMWGCSGFCSIHRLQWFFDPPLSSLQHTIKLAFVKIYVPKRKLWRYITFYSFRDISTCFKRVSPVNLHASGEWKEMRWYISKRMLWGRISFASFFKSWAVIYI